MSGALLASGEPIPPPPSQTCYNALQIATFGWIQQSPSFNNNTLAHFGWICAPPLQDKTKRDYCAAALLRLAEQFKDKTLLEALICALIQPFQTLEFVFEDLRQLRTLQLSVGAQLDGIGDILGLPRFTPDDDAYRTALTFQVAVNSSSGEANIILQFAKQLTKSSFATISTLKNANYLLQLDGGNIDGTTRSQIKSITAAGVGIEIHSTFGNSLIWGQNEEGGIPNPTTVGFVGETNFLQAGAGTISEKI